MTRGPDIPGGPGDSGQKCGVLVTGGPGDRGAARPLARGVLVSKGSC